MNSVVLYLPFEVELIFTIHSQLNLDYMCFFCGKPRVKFGESVSLAFHVGLQTVSSRYNFRDVTLCIISMNDWLSVRFVLLYRLRQART